MLDAIDTVLSSSVMLLSASVTVLDAIDTVLNGDIILLNASVMLLDAIDAVLNAGENHAPTSGFYHLIHTGSEAALPSSIEV